MILWTVLLTFCSNQSVRVQHVSKAAEQFSFEPCKAPPPTNQNEGISMAFSRHASRRDLLFLPDRYARASSEALRKRSKSIHRSFGSSERTFLPPELLFFFLAVLIRAGKKIWIRVMSSTPHKLNVTFWDMPMEKPKNNGYAGKIPEKTDLWYISVWYLVASFLLLILIWTGYGPALIQTTNGILPFAVVMIVNFWHGIFQKGNDELPHVVFCASIFGEILGASIGFHGFVHLAILAVTGFILDDQMLSSSIYAACRMYLRASLLWMPGVLTSVLCHASILVSRIAAKYLESCLTSKATPEVKLSIPRRRRTSNNTIFSIYKVRRTSLPALGGSNKSVHPGYGFQNLLKRDCYKLDYPIAP